MSQVTCHMFFVLHSHALFFGSMSKNGTKTRVIPFSYIFFLNCSYVSLLGVGPFHKKGQPTKRQLRKWPPSLFFSCHRFVMSRSPLFRRQPAWFGPFPRPTGPTAPGFARLTRRPTLTSLSRTCRAEPSRCVQTAGVCSSHP